MGAGVLRFLFLAMAASFCCVSAASAQTIRCSSDDGRRNFCATSTRGGVILSQQISGSPCTQGYSWGYDRNGIWVDHGCRADFRVNPSGGNGETITCSSDDERRHSCEANTRWGVTLVRQISGSPCTQGYSWGYEGNRGIWVDHGCRAEFEINSNGGESGNINCSSDDEERHHCPAFTGGGVRLVRQISGSPCTQGYSWGYDRDGIWVDHGCRAEFAINSNGGESGNINCSSDDEERHHCPAFTGGGVRLVRQISGSPCTQGHSWGFDRGGIWVDHGCRAEFALGGEPSGGREDVTCASDDGSRQYCQIGPHRRVNLKQQISGSPCRAGQSWGEDANRIWVDHGCRAVFRVKY